MKPKSEPSQLARYRSQFLSRVKPAPASRRRLPAPASGPVPVPLGTMSREPRPSTSSGCRKQSSPTQERRPSTSTSGCRNQTLPPQTPSSSGCRNPPQTPTTPRLPHTCFARSTAKRRKLPDELTPAYQQAALGKTYLTVSLFLFFPPFPPFPPFPYLALIIVD